MEVLVLGIIVVLGFALYWGWQDIKKFEEKKEEAAPPVTVVTNKTDVVTIIDPVTEAPAEVVKAQENVEKVRKAAVRKAPVKKAVEVKEEAPAKVTKVKRQYTKKSKE